jgi:oligoendopeptidase F
LERISRSNHHKLSEIEEQIIVEKDKFGITGWSELQSIWLNTKKFSVIVEGVEKTLSYGEANGLLTHHDSDTRISANKSIYGALGKDELLFSSSLRNICGDWLKICKRRHYDNPMHQSLISNDITGEIIESLMQAIDENSFEYRRYLKIKAELLGVQTLMNSDIMAPPPKAPKLDYSWHQAKDLVIKAYGDFSKEFENVARDMLDKNHVDASPRDGKRNGAFCTRNYNGKTAYILQTFTGSLNGIYTLAHEMGHAVHAYLSSKEQTFFNTSTSMVGAETASIFGELLLTDTLLAKSRSVNEKIKILTQVLDGAGQAAFQVSARVWFEQSMYDCLEKGEFLDGKMISKLWCAGRDRIYQDAVEWFDEMKWEWTMKPHYFMPNFRFYNYPYVFAQLFVYALYRIYKNEGSEFIPKFRQILALGGSLSPVEIAQKIGLNIENSEFWKLGIMQFRKFVDECEKLIGQN